MINTLRIWLAHRRIALHTERLNDSREMRIYYARRENDASAKLNNAMADLRDASARARISRLMRAGV